MGTPGLEHPPETSGETAVLDSGRANSDATLTTDPRLRSILDAWPHLSDGVRAALVAMAEAGR
jgi:hypothetical protein